MTSLLPPNATPLERGFEAASARLSAVPTPLDQLWNPDTCPVALLPYLAWALSIDVWSPDWPEGVKRERIRRAIAIQRSKGTLQSVQDVVASFGGSIVLREWWETNPPGDPHTFALVLSLSGAGIAVPSAQFIDEIIDDIGRTKPVRSHFTFTLALSATASIGTKGVMRPVVYARLPLSVASAS